MNASTTTRNGKRSWFASICLVPLSLACLCAAPLAQELSDQQIEDIAAIVESRMETSHLAGVAVCVVKRGRPIYCESFGYADCVTKRELRTDTPFQLASISKQFAATCIMLLAVDGKIDLDDDISKHLSGVPDTWSPITIRQLMAHTAGVKDYTTFENIRADYQLDIGRADMLELIYGHPLEFEPGSKFSYSNCGYTLLGCIVESVSGMDYAEFLEQRIFSVLGMKNARLEPVQNEDPLRAIGHDLDGQELRHSTYNSPTWAFAAGGIVASIEDMAKWDAAVDGNQLLDAKAQAVLWAPQQAGGQPTGFGLGWKLTRGPDGKRFVLHPGGKPGFSTIIARLLEDRLTIIVLSNRTEGHSSTLLDEIGSLLLQ